MTIEAAAGERPTRVRYAIIALIFVITSINYADRATFSIAGSAASTELGLSAVQTGFILSAFAWAYVLAQIPGGALLDRFGTKRIYAGAILIWSIFTASQGLTGLIAGVSAVSMLFCLRFLVGLAEAPSFPGNARLVAAWFPGAERGTASAIFNSAQYFSLVAFAPLMGWLVHDYGWRAVFWVMGALGLCASAVFVRFIHSPVRHPAINRAELDHIEAGGGLVRMEEAVATRTRTFTWNNVRQLLANRMLLGIYLGQYCINVLTYFFVTWFPIYLVKERGLNILEAGFAAAAPALCGFVGGLIGGYTSDWLLKAHRIDRYRAQGAARGRHAARDAHHRMRVCGRRMAGRDADGGRLLRQGHRLARLGGDVRCRAKGARRADERGLQHVRQRRGDRDPDRHRLYRRRDRIVRSRAGLRRCALPADDLRLPRHRRPDPATGADPMRIDRRTLLGGATALAALPAMARRAPATLRIATPMAAPDWAVLQRRLLAANAAACEAFYARYIDERGWLKVFARWGANDGPDDAAESTNDWALLHALGGSDRILDLYQRAWEGHLRQYTAARTVEVPIARQGMYFREFPVQMDWQHNAEGLTTFNCMGLSTPRDAKLIERTMRYADFYTGRDPTVRNYDPKLRIVRSLMNGSRGPKLTRASELDWAGDPFAAGARFHMEHGETTYAQTLAHYAEYGDVVGDNPLNLQSTTLGLNAFALGAGDRYRIWALDYLDAWVDRARANSDILPSRVGLDGTVPRDWWSGVYGWGFSPIVPQTGEAREPQPHPAFDHRFHDRHAADRRWRVHRRLAAPERPDERGGEDDRRRSLDPDDVRRRWLVRLAEGRVPDRRIRDLVHVADPGGSRRGGRASLGELPRGAQPRLSGRGPEPRSRQCRRADRGKRKGPDDPRDAARRLADRYQSRERHQPGRADDRRPPHRAPALVADLARAGRRAAALPIALFRPGRAARRRAGWRRSAGPLARRHRDAGDPRQSRHRTAHRHRPGRRLCRAPDRSRDDRRKQQRCRRRGVHHPPRTRLRRARDARRCGATPTDRRSPFPGTASRRA